MLPSHAGNAAISPAGDGLGTFSLHFLRKKSTPTDRLTPLTPRQRASSTATPRSAWACAACAKEAAKPGRCSKSDNPKHLTLLRVASESFAALMREHASTGPSSF